LYDISSKINIVAQVAFAVFCICRG